MYKHLAPARLFSMQDRVVFITGGAGGIAAGLCDAFAAAGARLVLVDRNDAVEARAADLRAQGAQVETRIFDITDDDAARAALEATRTVHGRLDVLVNNAAIIVRKPFLELDVTEWQRVMDINVTASFRIAQHAARIMVAQGCGRIINLGSIMNHVSRPNLVPYVTAKGAISAMTRAMAADLGGTGVTVNALAPGYTETEFSQANQKDFFEFIRDWVPVRRWGKPEDLCGAALLLASDAGSYINGQTLYVDGGFLAVTR